MPNKAFNKKLEVSEELQAIVRDEKLSRPEVTKRVWAYIKKHGLQNPKNRRNIIPDEVLGAVVGKKELSMFELTAKISKHLT